MSVYAELEGVGGAEGAMKCCAEEHVACTDHTGGCGARTVCRGRVLMWGEVDRASTCIVSTRRLKSAREIIGPLFAACQSVIGCGVKGDWVGGLDSSRTRLCPSLCWMRLGLAKMCTFVWDCEAVPLRFDGARQSQSSAC